MSVVGVKDFGDKLDKRAEARALRGFLGVEREWNGIGFYGMVIICKLLILMAR